MPAAVSARTAASGEPASAVSAARAILRRWANAASTTAKTSWREAVVSGGSRRSRATRAESTFGTGQNTLRPMVEVRRADAYQATLADGMPYVRVPGGAASRSATSACTMTTTRSRVGNRSRNVSRTGTETL